MKMERLLCLILVFAMALIQDDVVEDIIATAKDIKKKFDINLLFLK